MDNRNAIGKRSFAMRCDAMQCNAWVGEEWAIRRRRVNDHLDDWSIAGNHLDVNQKKKTTDH